MSTVYFELLACGQRSTEQALMDAGLPVPASSQVIAHEPTIECSCDTLQIWLGSGRNAAAEHIEPLPGIQSHPNQRLLTVQAVTINILLSRCVHLQNPLTKGCWEAGNVEDYLLCPGDDITGPPASLCVRAPGSKAEETSWLLMDRWLLETAVPRMWNQCLCDGHCAVDCETYQRIGCGARIVWESSAPFDGGGCGGTVAQYGIELV